MVDAGLYLVYAMMFVSIASWLGLETLRIAKHPAAFMKSIYGIGGLIVVFLICFFAADSTVKDTWAVQGVTPTMAKLIGASLMTFYLILIVAVAGLIYSEVNKVLK